MQSRDPIRSVFCGLEAVLVWLMAVAVGARLGMIVI